MRGMGKAMMGTGEASGEKRAQQAAEAAIANPLLDESSMKGARGLLISITGGNDLTLFEVDEAATRIREEVDPDANIILGATFDESLDGIIRVSVVATGIDREAEALLNNAPSVNTNAPAQQRSAVEAPAAASPQITARSEDAAAKAVASLERELAIPDSAPVATATDPDVQITRYKPEPHSMKETSVDFEDAPSAQAVQEEAVSKPYIPPAPEQHAPSPRMPRVEDFPPIAQREMMAKQTTAPAQPAEAQAAAAPSAGFEVHDEHDEDRRPMGLLRRLASGLGRREDQDEDGLEASCAPAPSAPAPAQPAAAPTQRPVQQRSEAAGAMGQLDSTGRTAPKPVSHPDDEQLEIPAFLRRQAN